MDTLLPGAAARCFLVTLTCLAGIVTGARAAVQEGEKPRPKDVAEVLRDLEATFATVSTVQTRFVQEKELAVFKQTIVLKGEIALENPGKLAWHVHSPVRYSIVISGNVIRQWDEDTDRVERISMSGNPVFKAVTKQLQVWFRGKYASMADEYTVKIVDLEPVTVLEFVPREGTVVDKTIKQVTVTFRPDRRYVKEILVEEVSGDRTRMVFVDTVLNDPIPADTWEVRSRG